MAMADPHADLKAADEKPSSFANGMILDDKYEIVARIGVGGMGEVFKARHVHLDTIRCVKVVRKDLTANESLRGRFAREGIAATRLHHPNVATVHDFSKLADGSYYMVTEFIDGLTLRQWAAEHGRCFSVPFAVEIALQVLAGLQHCHDRGLLHRDISFDNIMISRDSTAAAIVKIIDLGIAKAISEPRSDATREGLFVGNPRYSSPEQLGFIPDGDEIDPRADLYCLGVVLYEMVAGSPPFMSGTPQGYAAKHLTQPVPSFAVTNPALRLPDGFEAVIMKALEKDRRKRYSSARMFARALKSYASGIPLTTWATMPANTPVPAENLSFDANTATEPLTDKAAKSIAPDSDPTLILTPAPPKRRTGLRFAAAGIVALMVSGAVILEWPRRAPTSVSSKRTSHPVATIKSYLAIDALPWGQVTAIVDSSGRNVLPQDGVHYTPLALPIAPGRYRVFITNPKQTTPLLLNADVPKAGGITTAQANFGPSEAAGYFARVAQ
jgi:serine/threonine protein kinase